MSKHGVHDIKHVTGNGRGKAFLLLLRLAWTKDGWVDTLFDYDDWDDDATNDHLDLDLD